MISDLGRFNEEQRNPYARNHRLIAMGEAARRKRSHRALLQQHRFCIFCGGVEAAPTIEHCPPRMMFRGKRRPDDLVFPSCERCNHGTSMSDLVASLVGRFYPAPPTDVDKADVLKLFAAVRNNVPALLQEMHLTEAEEKVRRGGRSIPSGAGALRADGPILTSYMQTFGAKLGLALHFELHQKSVPISGGVLPFWFSKAANGEIPPRLLETLPAPLTMTQGKEHVADQFQYSWATTEQRDHTLLFAVFRQSFAVAAFTDNDRTWLEGRLAAYENIGGNLRIFAPGEVQDPPVNRL